MSCLDIRRPKALTSSCPRTCASKRSTKSARVVTLTPPPVEAGAVPINISPICKKRVELAHLCVIHCREPRRARRDPLKERLPYLCGSRLPAESSRICPFEECDAQDPDQNERCASDEYELSMQCEPPHLSVMVEVHENREAQTTQDYERDEREVHGRSPGVRGEVSIRQGDEPSVAECGDRVKDRLEQALAIAESALYEAGCEDHRTRRFDEESDSGYLPYEPENVAWRVSAP